ncbi:MAG: hypothetical protein KDK33_10635 [Leptospiraceae bacterium]|nr:hypothetical protein [Leptospiraceae bacterium]
MTRPWILILALIPALFACKPDDKKLAGTRWLCNEALEKSESANLSFPNADAPPPEGSFFEGYGKDGSYTAQDPFTGEDLNGDDIKASRYALGKDKDGNLTIGFDFQDAEGNWTPEEGRIIYVIKQLDDKRYHTVADQSSQDEGGEFYHETKCSRLQNKEN